ncbi:preprotein translocase subunit SecG [Helicobacter aurati]|uniref:Protein-export membrane protein SecG n=1 Tax=Helicobacter aurati TaxID=137778 RepID=A0A3D8J5Y0_9HELI|nr:preprotein translocase subunit SecG [Helicobacter aurati]RDU72899.1 preprotein translocase subunit SecG [Helicobacter aurati]
MTDILIIIQVILSISIVAVVLLQKSSSIGLGAYSGSNESLFGAKGPANFMAKITMFLGLVFIVNTVALGYLYNVKANKSITDGISLPKETLPISVPFDGFNTNNTTPLSNPNLNANQQQPILNQNNITGTSKDNATINNSQPIPPFDSQHQEQQKPTNSQ